MKLKIKFRWLVLLLEMIIIVYLLINLEQFKKIIDPKVTLLTEETEILPTPEVTQGEDVLISQKKEKPKNIILTPTLKPTDSEPWGVSKQIGEYTWTIKVGEDEKIATPKEILEALNEYRKVQGSQILTWDEKLANYAQERSVYLNKIKSVDQHEGFNDFLKNQDGFNKLGFTALGENISYGYKLNGVHIIEWMYAGDKPHNDNQLNNRWDHVGIGVDGLATCLIFGTGKF
jgi:uncharacterized protein YkwD